MSKENIIQEIKNAAVLPLFYNDDMAVCVNITAALYQAGIRSVEFTNRGEHALDNFKELVRVRDEKWPGLLLGIGTIKTVAAAEDFVKANADFLVSPFFDQHISDFANANDVLWIPGCMTPSEIQMASGNGHHFIKLFPGNVLTPQFVKSVKPLFPNEAFMITGGVSVEAENIKSWFSAGAAAVGLGSNLISNQWNANDDYTPLIQQTAEAIQLVNQFKK